MVDMSKNAQRGAFRWSIWKDTLLGVESPGVTNWSVRWSRSAACSEISFFTLSGINWRVVELSCSFERCLSMDIASVKRSASNDRAHHLRSRPSSQIVRPVVKVALVRSLR